LCPLRGEIFLVTTEKWHPIKTQNLILLRPLFEGFLQMHPRRKVKFIFVVPPNKLETFAEQRYVSPLSLKPVQQTADNLPANPQNDLEVKVQSKEDKRLEKQRRAVRRKEARKMSSDGWNNLFWRWTSTPSPTLLPLRISLRRRSLWQPEKLEQTTDDKRSSPSH